LLFGSITALAGTIGKPIGALQAPPAAAAGGSPWMLISAADDHGPRLPASVKAVRRTNLAETGEKTAYFVVLSLAQVPEATGELQVVPSVLTEMEYFPIVPFRLESWRGR
jgi:hypothetical protein